MTAKPTLAVVGPGRVGWAVARAARAAGYDVTGVAGGTEAARARLAGAVGASALADPAEGEADILVLALPDAVLAEVALRIRARTTAYLVHTAGALSAAALGVAGAGTFHPLLSFVGAPRDADLVGYGVALEADDDVLRTHLAQLARDLEMLPLEMAPEERLRYHAAAVLAGNAPIALLDLAARQLTGSGVPAGVAERVIVRLFASVASNATEFGIHQALSGPVRRGDASTVERHLDALADADAVAAEAYAVLMRAALDVARELPDGPDANAVEALRTVLAPRQSTE